jgi:hypothetical protein
VIELAAVIAGAKTLGLPGLPAVLRAVSGYEDEQTKTLKVIESDVRALVMQEYFTGRDYLASAARNEPGSEHSRRFLEDGVRALRNAAGVFKASADHYNGSAAALYLASTYATLGPQHEAAHWAERAHQEAVLSAEDAIKYGNDQMDVRIGRFRYLSLRLASMTVIAVLLYEIVALVLRLPNSYVGSGVTAVLAGVSVYLAVRFLARNVISFLLFTRLRRWEAFVEDTREVCAEIIGPQPSLPRHKLSLTVVGGSPVEYALVPADDGR